LHEEGNKMFHRNITKFASDSTIRHYVCTTRHKLCARQQNIRALQLFLTVQYYSSNFVTGPSSSVTISHLHLHEVVFPWWESNSLGNQTFRTPGTWHMAHGVGCADGVQTMWSPLHISPTVRATFVTI